MLRNSVLGEEKDKMSKIEGAVRELHRVDSIAGADRWIHRIYPSVKLILTVFYIAFVVSYGKYQLPRLILMGVYPIVIFILGDLSLDRKSVV